MIIATADKVEWVNFLVPASLRQATLKNSHRLEEMVTRRVSKIDEVV